MLEKMTIPSGSEMVKYLSSTGFTYAEMARRVGCDSSTLIRIRDNVTEKPSTRVIEQLLKLYIDRAEEMAKLVDRANKLGLTVTIDSGAETSKA